MTSKIQHNTLELSNPKMIIIKLYRTQGELTAEHPIARMHNTHECYRQEKWPTLYMAIRGRERSISATELFQRKRHKYFDLCCPLSTFLTVHVLITNQSSIVCVFILLSLQAQTSTYYLHRLMCVCVCV